MCTPVAAIGFGLSAASQMASFAGKQQATDAYNDSAMVNRRDAGLAATRKYEDEGRRYIYDTKANLMQGYDAIMRGRQAKGTAVASAGTAGLDMSSLNVGAILSNENNKIALNESKINLKQEDSADAYDSRTRSYEAEAQGRINSMPLKAGPNPLSLALGIANAGLGSAEKGGMFD